MHRGHLYLTGFVVGCVAAAVTLGCQVVLGDFELDPSPPKPSGLGSACEPNAFFCDGDTLEVCADDRRGFEPVETCKAPATCDATAGSCRPCLEGEFACNGTALSRCDAAGQFQPVDTCPTPVQCTVAADRKSGVCATPICSPAGGFHCDNAALVQCRDNQDGYELVEDCGSADLCDADAAAEAVAAGRPAHCVGPSCGDECAAPTCSTPGAVRCTTNLGPFLEFCGADRVWSQREACASPTLCSATEGRCLPPACSPGEQRCAGQDRQVCSSDLSRFERIERCKDSDVCTPEGCVPGPCPEAAVRCNDGALERCVSGKYVPQQQCTTAALCDELNHTCVAPTCGGSLGNLRCRSDIVIERCSAGRDVWTSYRTCTDGNVCNAPYAQAISCQMP